MKKNNAIQILESAEQAIRQNTEGQPTPVADALAKALKSLKMTNGYNPNQYLPQQNVDVLVKLDDGTFDIDHVDKHYEWTWGEDAGIVRWWYFPGEGDDPICRKR